MTNMKKVVVIGGTGLIGSKALKLLQDAATKPSPQAPATASTPTRAKDWPRRLLAPTPSSTCRI